MKKIITIISILGLIIAFPARAAISFSTSSTANTGTTGTNLSFTYNDGSDANRMLFCGVVGDVTNDTVTTSSYAGVNMTKIDKVLVPGNRWIYLFGLANPASGSNNFNVTSTASVLLGAACSTYSGAAQTQVLNTDIVHSTSTDSNTTNAVTSTLTTTVDNSWSVMFTLANGEASYTPTGGVNRMTDTVTYGYTIGDTNSAKTPPGSVTMTEKFATTRNAAAIFASFSPFVAAASSTSPTMQVIWVE